MSVTILETVESTNIEARDSRYGHGDVVVAMSQTAGRGQRGSKWLSREGESLTFSLVLTPFFLPAAKQFFISECATVSVAEALDKYGVQASIKWPNDVYVGDNKVCGMLIENDLSGNVFARSIVGIGVNINQTKFDPSLPNPTSMKLETGNDFDIMDVFQTFYDIFMHNYSLLENGQWQYLSERYLSRLYGLNEERRFERVDGSQFLGIIRDVRHSGELIIEYSGRTEGFLFKEIKFCL